MKMSGAHHRNNVKAKQHLAETPWTSLCYVSPPNRHVIAKKEVFIGGRHQHCNKYLCF